MQLIEERLNESAFGIIVVTTENQNKTWLNFEAGALSKRFEGGSGRVVPVLVNFEDFYQIEGPIRQFQGVMLDKDGMRELLQSISAISGADWAMVEARFDWSWDEFEDLIRLAVEEAGEQPDPPKITDTILLQDILRRISSIEKASRGGSSPITSPPLNSDDLRDFAEAYDGRIARILDRNDVEARRIVWIPSDRASSGVGVEIEYTRFRHLQDLHAAGIEIEALGVEPRFTGPPKPPRAAEVPEPDQV